MLKFKKSKKGDVEQVDAEEFVISAEKDKQEKKKQKKASKEVEPVLGKGIMSIKDMFAPPSIDRSDPTCIRVGTMYTRNYVLTGYPNSVSVGWLDELFHYEGDMDTVIYINPADERTALDELTAKITQYESQLHVEMERGTIRNGTVLRNKIQALYAQRERLEQNYESLFHIQIAANLYTKTAEELSKEDQKLQNKLKGRKIKLEPSILRQDDGYKTVLPFGVSYLPDKFRNLNSSALVACFPFYNSEVSHPTGVFLGVNMQTNTPMFIDFYNRTMPGALNNANLTVFGKAGSGKTFLVSTLTLRSTLKGIRTAIIDPEGEYKKLTDAVGGSYILIAPNSKSQINPFDLEEEYDDELKKEVVNVKDKVADVLNLVGVMARGLTPEQLSMVSSVVSKLYENIGITEDPGSLFESSSKFDAEKGVLLSNVKKKMPTFSDFHDLLTLTAEKEESRDLKTLVNALRIFKRGGIYDMFDCQTSEELRGFKNSPVVTFDISKLEENILRPIGMYIALSWSWEKFGKKNPEIKKRIICDEAWMLTNKNMAGNEYTAQFLETSARRIRKRNGGLLVASQNFTEFADNPQGAAVLTNASVNIFLEQSATDIDAVQDKFKLSDGERQFLLSARKGEFLIRLKNESSIAYALAFDFEKDIITNPYNVRL
ncbi:VirB4 family type IV secretion system protein [Lysinibacillus sp. UGB7]|uniref:VirB4 family type IV secretion system protein n=1 Tax=Lysinibacillus sp. UGB7 TaxID=3411039 RepID=UPI003B821155